MATVRAKAQDGRWETFGADRVRGVWPEQLRATADDWGPATLSFVARRDPGAVYPDLSPATPVEMEVAGRTPFGGFVWEPPQQADERALAVECRGWQYHLDDDLVDRLYVHSRLNEWGDTRQSVAADLAVWQASGFVAAGEGQVLFGWEQAAQANAGQHVGVTLDLGPTMAAKRVVVQTARVGSSTAFTFVVRGSDNGNPNPSAGDFSSGKAQDIISVGHELLTDGFRSGTFTTPHRFITIFMFRDDGLSAVTTADFMVALRQVMLFRDAAYESGNASILKASDVVKDLLPYAPLLDQRTDLIQTSDVVLPDFMLQDSTPRQGMEQANAVQGWQLRVTPERMLEYRPRPSVPQFRVGRWGGSSFQDLSRGSLEPIHNRVIVTGNDQSGRIVRVDRRAADFAGPLEEVLTHDEFDQTVGNLTGKVTPDGKTWAGAGSATDLAVETTGHTAQRSAVSDANTANQFNGRIVTLDLNVAAAVIQFDAKSSAAPGDASNHRAVHRFTAMNNAAVGGWQQTGLAGPVLVQFTTIVAGGPGVVAEVYGPTYVAGQYYTTIVAINEKGEYAVYVYAKGDAPGAPWITGQHASLATGGSLAVGDVGLQDERNGATADTRNYDNFRVSSPNPTPTIPDRRGFTRARGVSVSRPLTVLDATKLADAAIRQETKTAFKGDAPVVGRGGLRRFLGDASVHPADLLRNAGELVHASHLIDPDNGNIGRDGRLVEVAYDDETVTAEPTLDSTRTDFETQLGRYEATGRR